MLAIVSHDLRNPLAIIGMKAEHLSRTLAKQAPSVDVRKHIDGIQSAANKMSQLISDLLDLGSIESGQLTIETAPHEVSVVLEVAVDDMQGFAHEKGIQLRAEIPNECCKVGCDLRRIHQVLSNLISNAVKFTPPGGSIAVAAARDGAAMRVTVADSGAGMEAEHVNHIFDRYYQGPGKRGGFGLGLYIAKGIVTAHGGRIWAESTKGVGTKVHFTLQLVE